MVYIPFAELKDKGRTLKFQPWAPPPAPLNRDVQDAMSETDLKRQLIYQMLLVTLLEENRGPTRDELLALLTKLDLRLNLIDAFHQLDGKMIDDLNDFLTKFE